MTQPAYELNAQPVGREDFYRIACDPRRSVAVEACAGAGKTWMLVSRILRALLEGAAPHEILAITFTKKAAGEMRQRLQEWLQKFAHESDEQLRQELLMRGVDPARAPELVEPLRTLHARLLLQGRSVQIRTFHSWFAALLRTAPLSVLEALGLPAAYELLEDDALAVAQVWRPFHARLLREPETRQDYEVAVATHGRFQTTRALEAVLQRRVEFALADAQGRVSSSVPYFSDQFPEFQGVQAPLSLLCTEGTIRQQLVAAAQTLGQASQPTFSAKGDELEQALNNGDADGVLSALLTQSGTARKFSDKVAGIEQVRKVQAQLLRVQEAEVQHQAWLHQQRMMRLARVLVDEFAALKRERGWVDMNDVERAALHLLSDPVLGGWVQERLDARTRHLLIDEFQDTSPLQWQALHAWLGSYAGSGGGATAPSLFIVGDPKQSIYRFRRAEPQVFIAAQDFVRALGGDLLSCDHTRRNAPALLSLVNQVMGQAQAQGRYPGFRIHTTESTEAGGVYTLPQILRPGMAVVEDAHDGWRDSLLTPRFTPEDTLRTLECRQAAYWLAAQIEGGLHPRDIMVLARKRDRLAVMEEELRALGIAAQQPEKTDLGEVPEVQDLVALLDVLVSPAHDLSLARALKSPLFGVGDDDLVQLALKQREDKRPWFDLLQQAGGTLPAALQATAPVLQRWKAWLDTLPPHDALDAIFADGDVLARYLAASPATQGEAVLARLQALLSAALQVDGGRYATPYAFVRALKAGGVPAPTLADADAVRLLTVHGAKGLEAPLVLLLDTDAQEPNGQTMGVLIDWPGPDTAPRSFIFLASETRVPPSVNDALQTEQLARAREEFNALYVAMTRAQRRLVLSSIQPHRASEDSWWQQLQPGCEAIDVQDFMAVTPALPLPVSVPSLLPILPLLETPAQPASQHGPDKDAAEGPTPESLIGQTMHRLLEWAPLNASGWTPSEVQRAAEEFGLDEAQAQQAARMAQRILQGAGAWAWRADSLSWHGNEVPVTVQGRVRRIDRLVRRTDGIWWVLDYKSASQPQGRAELRTQLLGYRTAVQAACPGEPVRAAFLSAQGTMEEIE